MEGRMGMKALKRNTVRYCQVCGLGWGNMKMLQVHHIIPESFWRLFQYERGEQKKYLVRLCCNCHALADAKAQALYKVGLNGVQKRAHQEMLRSANRTNDAVQDAKTMRFMVRKMMNDWRKEWIKEHGGNDACKKLFLKAFMSLKPNHYPL
jgi:hypothetical protein